MLEMPILAMNGENDLMVAYKENLGNWKAFPQNAGNKHVTIKSFPRLNHLLLPCECCDTAEIPTIKTGISSEVLQYIEDWLNKNI